MLLSCVFQIGFLLEQPQRLPLFEGFILAGLIILNRDHWHRLDDLRQAYVNAWRQTPWLLSVVTLAGIYLFLQAVLLPPSSWDALTYHLPRVLLWEQNHSLFLRDFTISPQAILPVGSDILYHAFLRFRTDYGLGLFSWLTYGVILFGTYALSEPRFGPAIALTSALVIAGLPEIVYQSTATKNDIVLAAIALACVVWADRWLRVPSVEALAGLGLTLAFGMAVKTTFVLFAVCFIILWWVRVIRQGRLAALITELSKHWRLWLVLLVPMGVLSQGWLFWDNYQQFGSWLGTPEFAFNNQNNDGLLGGMANGIRYGFQSIHLLRPLDTAWAWLFGSPLTMEWQSIYDTLIDPWVRKAGFSEIAKGYAFEIHWRPQEDASWFGPLSVFIVLPAVIWSLVKGKRLSQTMAMVTVFLVLMISYRVGWSPWKSRFFTLPIAGTGICVATFFHQLRVRAWWLKIVQWASAVILIYACLFNYNKPMVPSDYYIGQANIWLNSNWTRDRLVYARLYHGAQLEYLTQALSSAHRVAIVGYEHYFYLMFHNPQLEFVLLRTENLPGHPQSLTAVQTQLNDVDHLVCFDNPCTNEGINSSLKLLWKNEAQHGGVPEVYEVQPGFTSQQPFA
jgi:hypothetical protein